MKAPGAPSTGRKGRDRFICDASAIFGRSTPAVRGPTTGQRLTFAGITADREEITPTVSGVNGTGHDPTAKTLDVISRRRRSSAAACHVPADLAGEPALQSRSVDPGRRRGLGYTPDDVVRRQGRAGADGADAAGDADLDAGRRHRRHV